MMRTLNFQLEDRAFHHKSLALWKSSRVEAGAEVAQYWQWQLKDIYYHCYPYFGHNPPLWPVVNSVNSKFNRD